MSNNDETLEARPLMPADPAEEGDKLYGTKKLLRYFDEYAKRSSKEHEEHFKAIKEINRKLLAKAHAMQEMGEIHDLAGQRFKQDWEKHRGLSDEQWREIHSQLYLEELTARMQQDVLNQPTANWEEHRRRRIELIQWSKLSDSDKEKWLEFYNKPNPNLNLNEGENYADQTQEHPDGHNSPQSNE